MGACTFEVYAEGVTLGEAFQRAYEQTGWEDGHSYSGTLSSKSGAAPVTRTPMPRLAALRYAQQLVAADDPRISDKWGDAGAIPVCADNAVDTRKQTVRVRSVASSPYEAERDLAAAARLRDGEFLVSVTADELPTLQRKVTCQATKGAVVTRYRAIINGRVVRECDTQAEARRALTEIISQGTWGTSNGTVEGVRVRVDGEPLVRATSTPVPRTITGTVTVGRVRAHTQPIGWLMFGWAPS